MIHTIAPDEFLSDDYASDKVSMPYLQVLSKEDPDKSGFFIAQDCAERVNFMPDASWEPFEARFRSGTVAGFRSTAARLVILRRSPLLMFGRKQGDYRGLFDKELYNADDHILKMRYLVYLLSKDRRLLHDQPLQFTAKGSLCGCFGEHYGQFRAQMNQATGTAKPRGDKFFALSVFAVRLHPQLKSKKEQAWVASVQDHGVPTADNWRSFFLGYDDDLKQRLLSDFEAYADFGSPVRVTESDTEEDFDLEGF